MSKMSLQQHPAFGSGAKRRIRHCPYKTMKKKGKIPPFEYLSRNEWDIEIPVNPPPTLVPLVIYVSITICIVVSLKLGQSLEYQSYCRCDIRKIGNVRFGPSVLDLVLVLDLVFVFVFVLFLNFISACEASILCK